VLCGKSESDTTVTNSPENRFIETIPANKCCRVSCDNWAIRAIGENVTRGRGTANEYTKTELIYYCEQHWPNVTWEDRDKVRNPDPPNVPTFEFVEDKPDPREYIGFADAYSLGHSHGARNIHDKAIPITPYQWRKMYRDDDGQLFSYYKKGYNNYMGENDFNDVHDYETDLGLAAEELLTEPQNETDNGPVSIHEEKE
jgi:hypothetical protein